MATPTSLAPSQVEKFHTEGYLIVEDVFDPADLEPLRASLHAAITAKSAELKAQGKLQDMHEELGFDQRLAAIYRDSRENGEAVLQYLEGLRGGGFHSPEMFDLITHPRLLAAVRGLLDTTEVVASSAYRIRPKLPGIGRGNVPWHQDSGYFAEHCDTEMIITCWVPMVDATEENGCMQILPNTHREKVVRHHTGGNAGFLVIKEEDLPDDPGRAITAACPRGGVVFMTNRTPHCSTPNRSDHIRWSADLRFQSADVPSNKDALPRSWDEAGKADPGFYEDIQVACYPPEADFLVSSVKTPERVINYADYVKRREAYDKATEGLTGMRPWPTLAGESAS
ncbi:MAG: phytanoyl-CoA dioxygenase family protein [Synoicihabitans sp.]